ncbi:hypothetical protein B0T14DRAFT_498832 [Immersiella caudata]|uniref:Ig-like domain-containing protein n=1 Tax=Immersiella caudata TaxID=314043 RepID=A0AA39WDC0_9PEZI|nr:hypothetical protein B0T14DRAFT_498832 [Immersiella caudata]
MKVLGIFLLLGVPSLCCALDVDGRQADIFEKRQQSNVGRLSINPNPCHDSSFKTPVYSIKDLTASKVFEPISFDGPSHLNFTVVDTANNYNLTCAWAHEYVENWGREGEGPYPDTVVKSNCVATNDPSANRFHNVLTTQITDSGAIIISQIWICNITGGRFPPVYGAQATSPPLGIVCPPTGANATTYECQATGADAPSMQSIQSTLRKPSDYASVKGNPRSTDPEAVPRRQGPYPTKDCSLASLTYPDWVIDEPSLKSDDDLRFLVSSRATESRFRCAALEGTGDAHEGKNAIHLECVLDGTTADPLRTLPSLNATFETATNKISLQHEWTCGDDKGDYSTTFVAVGSAVLSLPSPTFVKGSLIKPVTLAPAVIPTPPNTDSPGCVPSSAPSWVLERFDYNLTSTPWYFQNGRAVGYGPVETVDIIIRNVANNLTVRCGNRADSVNLQYFGYPYPGWDLCDQPEPSTISAYAPYPIRTYVYIDRINNVFGVNQTWYCRGKDGEAPLRVNAFALAPNTTAAISCSSGPYSQQCANPVVAAGDPTAPCLTWQCTNTSPSPILTGSLLSSSPLPAAALAPSPDVNPADASKSCTALSVARGPVAWRIITFKFEAQYFSNSGSLAGRYQLSMQPPTYPMVQPRWFYSWSINGGGEGAWPAPMGATWTGEKSWSQRWQENWVGSFKARIASAGLVDVEGVASGMGNGTVGGTGRGVYVEMSGVWYCDDRDPGKPLIFNGTWNGFLPADCTIEPARFGDERTNTKITCLLQQQTAVYPEVDCWLRLSHACINTPRGQQLTDDSANEILPLHARHEASPQKSLSYGWGSEG